METEPARFVLALGSDGTSPPRTVGAIIATGSGGSVVGELAIGEGDDLNPLVIDAAITLLRSLPSPHLAPAEDWLAGLDGLTNGPVRLSGPWSWNVEPREALHWVIKRQGLTARNVGIIRDSEVRLLDGQQP